MINTITNIVIWLLMCLTIFAIMYVVVISSDRAHDAMQERERMYFQHIEDNTQIGVKSENIK